MHEYICVYNGFLIVFVVAFKKSSLRVFLKDTRGINAPKQRKRRNHSKYLKFSLDYWVELFLFSTQVILLHGRRLETEDAMAETNCLRFLFFLCEVLIR